MTTVLLFAQRHPGPFLALYIASAVALAIGLLALFDWLWPEDRQITLKGASRDVVDASAVSDERARLDAATRSSAPGAEMLLLPGGEPWLADRDRRDGPWFL